jgi:hypothetical protein
MSDLSTRTSAHRARTPRLLLCFCVVIPSERSDEGPASNAVPSFERVPRPSGRQRFGSFASASSIRIAAAVAPLLASVHVVIPNERSARRDLSSIQSSCPDFKSRATANFAVHRTSAVGAAQVSPVRKGREIKPPRNEAALVRAGLHPRRNALARSANLSRRTSREPLTSAARPAYTPDADEVAPAPWAR